MLVADGEAATLREVADRWKASRVDVAAGTMQTYAVALGRLLPRSGRARRRIDAADVADLVADMHEHGLRKQTIRKTVSVLAMVLDHAGINRTRLATADGQAAARGEAPEVAAADRRARRRRSSASCRTATGCPSLVLDATGMRVGELEALTWGDMDEPRSRWRIATCEDGPARWVTPPAVSSQRCSSSARATIAIPSGGSSRASAATAYVPR